MEVYDAFEGERGDLVHYLRIARELNAVSILDVGSGTGCLACLLNREGFEVTALEPAKASLDKARSKPGADGIRWIHGHAQALAPMQVDLAFMTGNVAQVFLSDGEFEAVLRAIRSALKPGGFLVFETRDPARRAWLDWTEEKTRRQRELAGIGIVEAWNEGVAVAGERVSFFSCFRFHRDDSLFRSKSTLRFRRKDDVIRSLRATGFRVDEIRDAPDRPGSEFVFIAGADGQRDS
ncbi:MAG: methyltransferase domain-containing protein [Geminicoccaceae bacterium]|nr:methyltransferase domain-containing protein [Geminicoccaceae bacterium]